MFALRILSVVTLCFAITLFPFKGEAGLTDKVKDKAKGTASKATSIAGEFTEKSTKGVTGVYRAMPAPEKIDKKIDATADKIDSKAESINKKAQETAKDLKK
ncbi:MAG: hypothetical protein N2572_09535 [Syntrophales bacterium]|nr:hypothetical protein [Syntrophales bacterium]